MKYDYTTYIGRFQPFHNGHLETCRQALTQSKHLIIIVGSAFSAPNIRNPFTFEQRREMIEASLKEAGLSRFTIVPVRDYFYNDNNWIADIQQKVAMIASPNSKIALTGFTKDHTSYYLGLFPQWGLVKTERHLSINATEIRNRYFDGEWYDFVEQHCPSSIASKLLDIQQTEQWGQLRDEFFAIQKYKKAWDKAPYAPTFVTSDAVVICGGHILLVRRKFQPGKGLFALPGGFIQQDEKIQDSCLRELREETKIKVPLPVLKGSIKASRVFDHPLRSVRGRTITHAFLIELNNEKELPKVKGSDDAEKAFWMPLNELALNMDKIFEDHFPIIESFVGRLV